LAGASRGLMILTPTEGEPKAKIAPRPPTQIEVVENDRGEHEYVIAIQENDPERVLRYGEIELNTLARVKGDQTWERDSRDLKHNGKIKLVVEGLSPSADTEAEIRAMAKRVEENLELLAIYAGDGQHDIKIDVEAK
jgi:hypothetical protein